MNKKLLGGLGIATLATALAVAFIPTIHGNIAYALSNRGKENVGTATTYSVNLPLKAEYNGIWTYFDYDSENKFAEPSQGEPKTLLLEWVDGDSTQFSISFEKEESKVYLGMSASENKFRESNSPVYWKSTQKGIGTSYNSTYKYIYYNNNKDNPRIAPYTDKTTSTGITKDFAFGVFYNEEDFQRWDSHCTGSFARECLHNLTYGIPVNMYKVSFDANGGTGTMKAVDIEEGEFYSLPACTLTAPEGKEFDYWSLNGIKQTADIIVEEDITLVANWKDKVIPVGTTVSVNFAEQGYSNEQKISTITAGPITITCSQSGNATKWYDNGSALRVYGGSTWTFSGATIVAFSLTFGSSDGTNTISTDVGTYNNGSWTGSDSSIVMSVGGTKGHRRITAISITYISNN